MRIRVTAKNIAIGKPRSASSCPVALRLTEVLGREVWVHSDGWYDADPLRPKYNPLPSQATKFIKAFDMGDPVKPFTFVIKRNSGVTIIGGTIALGLFVLILCGLLYVGAKLLDTLSTVQARHEERLTNEMKLTLTGRAQDDPVIQRLSQMPENVLLPAERIELSERAFFKWADSLETWAIIRKETLSHPWVDTGNRIYGASNDVRMLLFDLCFYEAAYTAVGFTKDGIPRKTGFYGFVPEDQAPVQVEEPEK